MTERTKYPREVAGDAFDAISKHDLATRPTTPKLPDAAELAEMLDAAFLASLGTNEDRPIAPVLVFASAADLEAVDPQPDLFTFTEPREFTAAMVASLSPAMDVSQTTLCVSPKDGGLKLWGILRRGRELDRARLGEGESAVSALPPFLGLRVRRGHVLELSLGEEPVVEWCRGELRTPGWRLRVDAGEIGARLAGIDVEPEKPPYIRVGYLRKLLARVQAGGHGGLVLLDLACEAPEPSRSCFRPTSPGSYGLSRSRRAVNLFRGVAGELGLRAGVLMANAVVNDTFDAVRAVAALTGVDGAVVVDAKLDVLSFGYMVPSPKTGPERVLKRRGPRGVPTEEADMMTRGAKHSAAVAFAHQAPRGIAFVVSQDGDCSAFFSTEKGGVYWWHDLDVSPSVTDLFGQGTPPAPSPGA